jgi:copper(I)-binding protein
MRALSPRPPVPSGLLALGTLLLPRPLGASQAEQAQVEDLRVVRVSPRGAKAQAADQFRLRNTGEAPLRLVGAETPLAEQAELYRMTRSRGALRSVPLPEGVTVPPGAAVAFALGGLGLRLAGWDLGPRHWVQVPLTPRFVDGSELTLSAPMRR